MPTANQQDPQAPAVTQAPGDPGERPAAPGPEGQDPQQAPATLPADAQAPAGAPDGVDLASLVEATIATVTPEVEARFKQEYEGPGGHMAKYKQEMETKRLTCVKRRSRT